MRRLGTITAFCVLLLSTSLAGGCQDHGAAAVQDHRDLSILPPVDLSKATCGPEPTKDDWTKAATVSVSLGSLDAKAKCAFLWNEKGIYCHIDAYDRMTNDPDSYFCISLVADDQSKRGRIELYFQQRGEGPAQNQKPFVDLFPAVAHLPKTAALRSPELDKDLYRFSSRAYSGPAFGGLPWDADVFVFWEAFSGMRGPPEKLFVHVFTIEGKRPYAFLKMERK